MTASGLGAGDRSHPRCADTADSRSEPLRGTASYVKRWLFIEQPGGWGRDALLQSRFPGGLGASLRAKTKELGIRVILIRRGTRFSDDSRNVYFASTDVDGSWLMHTRVDDVRDLMHIDLAPLAGGARVEGTEEAEEPIFLVCTHGRHDACCSIRGNQISRLARSAYPQQAWECSHIGGDRFAANVVSFPHGIYYGRVGPADVVPLIEELRRGRLSLAHYRGRSCYPFDVQAAELFLRRDNDLLGIEDLRLVSLERDDHPARVRVRFELRDGRRADVVMVTTWSETRHFLTCNSTRPERIPTYDLVSCTLGEDRRSAASGEEL